MINFSVVPFLCLIATLTSYSAESAAERDDSTKYSGDGYHGSNLNLWQQGGRPVVASTSSSCMIETGGASDGFRYRVEDNMAASTYSLNKLHPGRGPGSAQLSGSTHSIPLYLMPRPNSVAGKIAKEWRVCVKVCENQVVSSAAAGSHTLLPVRKEIHHSSSTVVSSLVILGKQKLPSVMIMCPLWFKETGLLTNSLPLHFTLAFNDGYQL